MAEIRSSNLLEPIVVFSFSSVYGHDCAIAFHPADNLYSDMTPEPLEYICNLPAVDYEDCYYVDRPEKGALSIAAILRETCIAPESVMFILGCPDC
jgi:hypothetical protein